MRLKLAAPLFLFCIHARFPWAQSLCNQTAYPINTCVAQSTNPPTEYCIGCDNNYTDGGNPSSLSGALDQYCAKSPCTGEACTDPTGESYYYTYKYNPDCVGACDPSDGSGCPTGSTCSETTAQCVQNPPAGAGGCISETYTGCAPNSSPSCCNPSDVCVGGNGQSGGTCLAQCATNDDCPGEVGCTGESCGCTDACDDPGCPGWTTSCAMGDSCTSDDDCPGGLVCVSGSCGCSDICDDPSCDPDGNYATDCGGGGGGYDPCADYYDDACCEDGYNGNNGNSGSNNGNNGSNNGNNNTNCAGLGQFCGLGEININETTGCCTGLTCGWDEECDWQ